MWKSEPTGGWLSRPFEEQDFPAASPGWVQGYNNGELAVREGRNEDKWSKVQPLIFREKSLRIQPLLTGGREKRLYPADSFMHRKPKNGARPVIISKISSLKLSPGRLWRLGGFQRLDTSSVFWPRASPGAAFAVPVFLCQEIQRCNSDKLLSGKIVERFEREKNTPRRCTKTKVTRVARGDKMRIVWWLRNLKTRAMK